MLKVTIPTIILINFLLLAPSAYAAISFSISNLQANGDEVSFDVSLSGLTSSSCPNTTCYLQAAFTAQDQTKYFGFTQNKNGEWYQYDGSPEKDYIKSTFFSFEPQGGSWSGKLTIKVDPQDSDYNGPGSYSIKAWRYTGNSNSASGSSDNILAIQLDTPAPSSSPSPTPSPKSPSPTTSSSKSTSTAKSPTPNPSPKAQSPKTQQATVLGQKLESTSTATPSASPAPSATPTPPPQSGTAKTKIASYLVGSGLIIIGLSIGLFLWFNKRLKTNEK